MRLGERRASRSREARHPLPDRLLAAIRQRLNEIVDDRRPARSRIPVRSGGIAVRFALAFMAGLVLVFAIGGGALYAYGQPYTGIQYGTGG